ncbi:MAG: caspase family protein [Cyanobacteria bacterium Co-bin13]|nr:caspase family protein [Cyanobacteria bacterium Co-bin13]
MAKHWAIVIGINQYQSLQPLMYAQSDAVELRDFLTQEAGLPTDQCALLTDVSPIFQDSAAYPARESLERVLQDICLNQVEAEDTLWFFFSGYGVSWEGQDFLLLIDADPSRIEETAVPLESVLKQLKMASTDNLVVVLDMNRSQSALPNQQLGLQTLELARSLGIPLLLSCQPDQFSQEALPVRHGLFTAAMLEGLRYHGRLVLFHLAQYLEERLPELCQLYARPVQNPVVAVPSEKRFLMLVPPDAVTRLPLTERDQAMATGTDNPGGSAPATAVAPAAGAITAAPGALSNRQTDSRPSTAAPEGVSAKPPAAGGDAGAQESMPAWQRWSLLAAGLLLLGVLVRNASVFLGPSAPTDPASVAVQAGNETPTAEPASAPPTGTPLFPANPTGAGGELSALERGRVAVTEQRYGEALTWLNQVPAEQRTEDFQTLLDQAQAGYARSQLTNEDVLNSARAIIQPVPASLFSDAIKRARQVPLGDPFYEQAQQDINRWSQVIIDLADGRAAAGQFDEAISAVQLVPDDRPELYQVAQARVARWQQQKINRDVLKQAQERLVPDQVSTFENAIRLVQDIPAGYPERPIAEERVEQWSQDILVIARARAAEGRLEDAIAAASRVPAETSAYEPAQQEIQAWQSQL